VREYLGPSDIANEISMKRSLFSGSFLVVEGTTDARLYGKFIDRCECEIIPAHSKDNVISSVKEMTERRNDGKVIGIIDPDTDTLRGIGRKPPLFVTDNRDLDTMLVRSGALDCVLTEYADNGKIERFVSRYGEIRDSLTAACYHLGLLMYVSERNEYGLSFKDLDHQTFTDRRSMRTDIDLMLRAVIENSQRPRADMQTIKTKLIKETDDEHDPWDVCRGHDLISVLAIGLRDIFGSYNCKHITSGALAGALRLAYDIFDMMSTRLFEDIEKWCRSNGMTVWVSHKRSVNREVISGPGALR